MSSPLTRLFQRFRARFGVIVENDATFSQGLPYGQSERDRPPADRAEILRQSIDAWRFNPLARRIVGLTSQYVVGGGFNFSAKQAGVSKFLHQFWEHPLNRLSVRVYEWCDELTRTGNLFILVSTDAAGQSYVRAVPAAAIERIEARPNDIEQPLAFYPRPTPAEPNPPPWMAYTPAADDPAQPVMLHYSVNRPVGGQWGESDLAPLLKWLSRYAAWLEDRARLNKFRTAFVYVVKGRFPSEAARLERQRQLNAFPPAPGSILVCDEGETWEVLSPDLESSDANTDGLALKKMICSGAGIPLHFLAEPESATRTTAESAGGPTFRHFEQRQEYFLWLIGDLLHVALARRSQFDARLPRSAAIRVNGADISARDNAAMALAANNIYTAFGEARDRALIDDAELLRLLYRFAGETIDIEDMLARGRAAPPPLAPAGSRKRSGDTNAEYINRGTGESGGTAAI